MVTITLLRTALSKFFKEHGRQIAVLYIQVPFAIIVLLFFAYLVDLLIALLPFTFPSSAVLMLIVFLVMIILHRFSPHKLSKWFHVFFGPAADFLLSQMGLFFTSSFILIPRRDAMPGREIGLVAALFLLSFLVTWVGTVGICKLLDIFKKTDGSNSDSEKSREEVAMPPMSYSQTSFDLDPTDHAISMVHPGNDATLPTHRSLELDVNATMTNNDTRLGGFEGEIKKSDELAKKTRFDFFKRVLRSTKTEKTQESAEDVMVRRMANWFDPMVYLTIFIIGIPLFFTSNGQVRSLPLFLGTVSLAWIFSRRVVPGPWQKFLHPILVTSAITILAIWLFGAIKGMKLADVLAYYSTGSDYLVLFRNDKGYNGQVPGSGDVMTTILVAGIVCLSFPLFRYRQDLYSDFFRILAVTIPAAALSLLLWPFLARVMGIDGQRGITFAGRFMSTPFGIQFIEATGGDSSLEVVLICVTGILAVLVRDHVFKLLRVRVTQGSEDHFTMGTTVGVIAAAIGTSSLLVTHPRAAATASVTFVIYGMILLALVAVPAIASFAAELAGMEA